MTASQVFYVISAGADSDRYWREDRSFPVVGGTWEFVPTLYGYPGQAREEMNRLIGLVPGVENLLVLARLTVAEIEEWRP